MCSEDLYDQVIFKSSFKTWEFINPGKAALCRNINISYTFLAYSKNRLVINKHIYLDPERELERLPSSSVALDSYSLQQASTSFFCTEEVG